MIKKRAVIWEERSQVQSIHFKTPCGSPASQPVSTWGWKIQKSAASSQKPRIPSSGPPVNKESARKLDAVECLTLRPDYRAAGRNNAEDFSRRHQKHRFNQRRIWKLAWTIFRSPLIVGAAAAMIKHAGTNLSPYILIMLTFDIEM